VIGWFTTSLALSSKVTVSVWMQVSPKPTMVSGRRAMTRTGTGSPPAGVPNALALEQPARPVQIGSGFDCTCSITQRPNCWSTACLA
jgi:hypothetical protein